MKMTDDSEKTGKLAEDYQRAMRLISDLLEQRRAVEESGAYLLGKKIRASRWLRFIGIAYDLARSIKLQIPYRALRTGNISTYRDNIQYSDTAALYDYKIAIYTCIIGNYDSLQEPLFKPGNVDYILFTDGSSPSNSAWKSIDIRSIKGIPALDASRVSRYVKLHPHLFLNDYDYSIYIDGNIQPCGDLRYLIHHLNPYGFASCLHYMRNCLYEEFKACILKNKDDERIMRQQINSYRREGMPEQYGLTESNLLVRDHRHPVCIEIMERWWREIEKYSRRDQLSLSYVLWRMGIPVAEIGQIGNDVYRLPLIRFQHHLKDQSIAHRPGT